ncbi:MAG: hypothetical protein JSV33_08715 [bacterium]|nr:MAG: hypothetical protein JSV33_08715 [bacterium]
MSSSKELVTAVVAAAKDKGGKKKLSCARAFELAAQHGVGVIEIGRICDEQDIKLYQCQLGCF